MARIAVFAIVLAGCDVGAIPGVGGTDAGSNGTTDGTTNVACEPISATPPAGHHNAGTACQVAGCHLIGQTGAGAPAFAYSGTLYKDTAGTQPYPGASIFVKLGGVERKAIAGDNGNFWIDPPPAGLEPPSNANQAETSASGCPNTQPMVGRLVQGGGNCNNCHRNGGSTLPVYLNP